ncbi:cell surface glycoprotein 1 [Nematolebias whitei]|uniref:cell surface glycoprotein 1 n=1 Tax=Nematolebias whitei TaxID=451745 RepID=UPI0018991016|nr:cell surface glycoprotein 1 [Nematolebias whitei]
MMSYLWILLLGSLLASHAKAQDDAAEEALDVVPEEAAVEGDPDAGAEDEIAATEAPQDEGEPEPEPEPEAGPEASVDEVEPSAPSDPEDPPSADEEPTEAGGDGEGSNEATEASVEEDPEAVTPAADPEADLPKDAETTPAPELEPMPSEGDTETEPPTPDSLILTTGAETILTTQGAGSGVVDAELVQTTQNAEKEVLLTTVVPTDQETIGGDEKTTPEPKDEQTTLPFILESEVEVKLGPKVNADTGFDLNDALDYGTEKNKPPRQGRTRLLNTESVIDNSERNNPSSQEGSSKPLAGVLSAIVVSAVGAVIGYFAYQKKKLCFKNREVADPEAGHKPDKVDVAEAQSDPQVLSNLLNSSQQ